MATDINPKVFLSYASENLLMVRKVYKGLIKRGLKVWFDKDYLKPGKWKPQIERAIRRSRYFIICLSNAAIRKTGDEPGFQDHELNEAYNIARDLPEQEFTIIPVRLEDCQRGDHRLTLFQQYDLFDDFDKGLDKLAVNIGGVSLSNPEEKDERSDDVRFIVTLYDKANAEFYAGRFEESITLYNAILALSVNNVRAWHNKGVALVKLNRHEEALDAYDRALQINPENAPAWSNKGNSLAWLGREEEALEAYNRALQIDSDDARVWSGKGIALALFFREEEAIEAMDRALQINPENVRTLLEKGIVLSSLGKYEEAIEVCDKILRINSENSRAWYQKGLSLNSLGRKEEALAAFNKALEISPNDPKVLSVRNFFFKERSGKL